jgi:hypothetical protein
MIGTLRRAGTSRPEILKTVSTKYRISPESVRWYLKGASGSVAKTNGTRRLHNLKKPKFGATNGARLLDVVKKVSVKALRKAIEAKKLLPRLQEELKRRDRLALAERKVKRALQTVNARARKLQQMIERLVASQ